MDGVRVPARHRAPRRHDPQQELFGWLCIQALALGVTAAAIREAYVRGDHGWAVILLVMAIMVLVTYCWCAIDWARWLFH